MKNSTVRRKGFKTTFTVVKVRENSGMLELSDGSKVSLVEFERNWEVVE